MRHSSLRKLLPDVLIAVGLFLLPLAFFWQVTVGNRTLLPADNLYQFQPWAAYRDQMGVPAIAHNNLLSDLVLENLPWKEFIRQSLANHELPLWNPYIFAGVPFMAAGQSSTLYPFSLIYYVIPLDKAYGWFTVSQLWLAGLLMYLFMRGLGIGRFGAIISAIAYQLSSFFIASVVFQMIIAAAAWFPFLLLMVEFTIRQRPLFGRPTVIPWIALGAVGLGMEILAGHVEFTYYALLLMGFWSACRLVGIIFAQKKPQAQSTRLNVLSPAGADDKKANPTRPFPLAFLASFLSRGAQGVRTNARLLSKLAASLLALVILGIGIGSIQFIPLLELARYNFREGSTTFDQVRSYAYPPRHFVSWLMPNFYGSPAQHDYLDMFTGQQTALNWTRPDGATVTDTYWEVNKNYVEGACYVGILTLILAVIALLHARFDRASHARIQTAAPYRGIFALLSLISVLFVFGTVFYAVLYYGLPGINQLHSPFRWVFPLTLCLAALAGFGAEALQRARGESQFGPTYWRSGATQSYTFRLAKRLGWVLIWLGVIILALLLAIRVFFTQLHGPLDSIFHKLAGADLAFPSVEAFYSVEFRQVLIFGLFVLGCGIVIRLSRTPFRLPRWLGRIPLWMPLAVIVLASDLMIASAGFNPAADPAWLKFEPPAITWLKAHDPQDWRFTAIEGQTHTMNANVGWLYGLQDVRGYDSTIPKQYVDYMEQIEPQDQLIYNRIAPLKPDNLAALDSRYLDALSVKYIVSENPIDTAAHPRYKQVYQDQAVYIYENSQAFPRAYLQPSTADLTDLTEAPFPTNAATFTENKFDELTLNVTGSGNLILGNSYFTGWRAYIRPQGKPASAEVEQPLTPVYGNFSLVKLPTDGAWTVRLRYSPPSFQVGGFTTFISAVILIFALLIWLWRRFYAEDTSEAGGVKRLAKNSLAPIFLNLFIRGIDFVFALITLRIISPADYGDYYYAIVIFTWFDTLTNFGLNLLLTREVARDRSQAGHYLLNSTVLRLGLAAAGVPVLIAFLAITQATKPIDPLAVTAILLLYIGLVPNSISYGLTALCYAFEKAEIPAAVSTVSSILKAILGLSVLLAGWGVLGLAGASIAINVITLIILTVVSWRLIRHREPRTAEQQAHTSSQRIQFALIRGMVVASWPLLLNNLLSGLFFKIDVTLLEPLKGPDVVAKYSTAYKWLDAIGLIPSLFTMALLPVMSRQAHEDRPAMVRSYQFAVKLLFLLALPVAVAVTFIAPVLIGLLAGQQYFPEGPIALQMMVWFIPIGWINSLTNYVLVALDQQKQMRWAFVTGVVFNIVANLIFIPFFSLYAAAAITVLSEVVLQIGFYRLIRRSLAPVPWIALLWKPVAAGAVMAAALGLVWLVIPKSPFVEIPASIVGGGVYLVALLALRPFSVWELDRFAALLPSPIRRRLRLEPASQVN